MQSILRFDGLKRCGSQDCVFNVCRNYHRIDQVYIFERQSIYEMVPWQIDTIIALAAALALFSSAAVYTLLGLNRVEKDNPPSGQFVDVNGGRLHLVDMGPAGAPVVVLIHGSSVNLGDMQLALGKRLSKYYKVILVDRPGHGWSDRRGGREDAAPVRQAKLIGEALLKIGVRRAALVAHSWGGAVALAYVLDNPQRVSGLVLLAPLAYSVPRSGRWYTNMTIALFKVSARIAKTSIIGPLLTYTLVFPLGQLLLGVTVRSTFRPQTPPVGYIDKTGARLVLRPSEFTASAQDIAFTNQHLDMQSPMYQAITVPTAIIAGDSDKILPPEYQAMRLAAALPRAKLDMLPGVGHMVEYAAPDRVVEIVGALLKDGAQ